MRRFITGKRPKKSAQTIAQLQKTINALTLKTRQLQAAGDKEQDLAKLNLRDGNKIGAAQALKRRQMYMNQLNATYAKVGNLRSIIATIQSTEDNVTMARVLRDADRVIQVSLTEASPEATEEIMAGLEESIESASFVEEALAGTSLTDIGLTPDQLETVDDQLAALEAEIQAEGAGPVRTAPEKVSETGEGVEELPSVELKEESDAALKSEAERLKREIQKSLQG